MRCSLRQLVLGAVLLAALYLVGQSHFSVTPPAKSKLSDWSWPLFRSEACPGSWVDAGSYLPLNVSYQLLAGTQTTSNKFLVVGLASVRRRRGDYLLPTLQSLFSQSSSRERDSLVVLVLLADWDPAWRASTLALIRAAHPAQLELGQLLVVHVPPQFYPPLTGLKRNYDDAAERVAFRSKQNVDYAFLMRYGAGLGRFYLQLEDDVSAAHHFLSSIQRSVRERQATPWVLLEFSSLGYIGKLYRAEHLPLLARFLFLFYQEMPCDWLLTHFRELLVQREQILVKPSLFQHMGTFSSFKGNVNKLKDKFFEQEVYSNPRATVYTDISVYNDHVPRLAWEAGEGFFWGRTPEPGSSLVVVFEAPAVVTGVRVETGSEGKDQLESGVVELGRGLEITAKGEKGCSVFQKLGELSNGVFEKRLEPGDPPGSSSSCLRLSVTGRQRDWIVVRKIRITVAPDSAPPAPRA